MPDTLVAKLTQGEIATILSGQGKTVRVHGAAYEVAMNHSINDAGAQSVLVLSQLRAQEPENAAPTGCRQLIEAITDAGRLGAP